MYFGWCVHDLESLVWLAAMTEWNSLNSNNRRERRTTTKSSELIWILLPLIDFYYLPESNQSTASRICSNKKRKKNSHIHRLYCGRSWKISTRWRKRKEENYVQRFFSICDKRSHVQPFFSLSFFICTCLPFTIWSLFSSSFICLFLCESSAHIRT